MVSYGYEMIKFKSVYRNKVRNASGADRRARQVSVNIILHFLETFTLPGSRPAALAWVLEEVPAAVWHSVLDWRVAP